MSKLKGVTLIICIIGIVLSYVLLRNYDPYGLIATAIFGLIILGVSLYDHSKNKRKAKDIIDNKYNEINNNINDDITELAKAIKTITNKSNKEFDDLLYKHNVSVDMNKIDDKLEISFKTPYGKYSSKIIYNESKYIKKDLTEIDLSNMYSYEILDLIYNDIKDNSKVVKYRFNDFGFGVVVAGGGFILSFLSVVFIIFTWAINAIYRALGTFINLWQDPGPLMNEADCNTLFKIMISIYIAGAVLNLVGFLIALIKKKEMGAWICLVGLVALAIAFTTFPVCYRLIMYK